MTYLNPPRGGKQATSDNTYMGYLGIDPGKKGGAAVVRYYPDWGSVGLHSRPELFAFEKFTPHEFAEWLAMEVCRGPMCAVLERVASSPQMGVCSAFTFGHGYGFMVGCLTALKIPYVLVTPGKWQKAMGCLTKGDKNVTKAKAQQLYPDEKITHATADALLLATYCRRHYAELF